MPGKNDNSFAAQEKKMLDAFVELLADMERFGDASTTLKKVGEDLRGLYRAVRTAGVLFPAEPGAVIPKEQLSAVSRSIDENRRQFVTTLSGALKSKGLKAQFPYCFDLLNQMAEVYTGNRTLIDRRQSMVNSLLDLTNFQTTAANLKAENKTEELKQHTLDYDLESLRPTFEDCIRPRVTTEPKKVFQQMLWLSEHCSKTEYDENGSFYQASLDRIRQQIAASDKDVQLEYAKLINGTAQAYSVRNKLTHSFCALANSFSNTPVGHELQRIDHNAMTIPENLAAPQKTAATERQKELSTLAAFYGRLADDTRSASRSFTALGENLGDLLAMNDRFPDGIPDAQLGAYHQLLTRAEDAANLYVSSHKTRPITDKGKERVELARQLQAKLLRCQEQLSHRFSGLRGRENHDEVNIPDDQVATLQQSQRLSEIAKVQRHIMPVRIVPKNPEYQAEPSKASEFFRSIGHSIVSGLSKYTHILYRGAIEIASKIFKKKNEQTAAEQKLNTRLIPGTDGETFRDDYTEAELKEKVIDDIRRVPLIWEKPIPEDPDQPPTVSFNFSQYVEGDDRYNMSSGGHSSVTLKYSKIDPITGKNTRYATTMGFYPSGGFDAKSIIFSQYYNGLRIPGQLMDDSDKVYDTRKTVTVDNLAINRILLAAQDYEKDGFNMVQRNCTNFVVDMAKAGGIDVSKVIKQVDIKGKGAYDAGIGIGSVLLSLAGPTFSLLAKRKVLEKTERDNLDYKNFGQKMVNSRNIQKLWQAEDNIRLRGYSPGHAGEVVRHEKGYHLDGTGYSGIYDNIRNLPENRDKTSLQLSLIAIKTEIDSFLPTLRQYVEKNGTAADVNQNRAAVAAVEKYCKTMFKSIEGHLQSYDEIRNIPSNAEKRKAALTALNGALDEFTDGLTEIFHGTFHGDEKLNIPFSHLASTSNHLKALTTETFQHILSNNVNVDLNRGNRDQLRQFLLARKNYKCKVPDGHGGEVEFKYLMTAPQLAAMLRVFGSLENGMKQAYLFERKGKEADPKLTRAMKTIKEFEKAEKYFFTGKKLTEKDLQFAFSTLPKLEKGQKFPKGDTTPSALYQSEVFNRIFPTVCSKIRTVATKIAPENYKIEDDHNIKYIHNAIGLALSKDLEKPEAQEALKQVKNALLPEVIATLQKDHMPLTAENLEKELNDWVVIKLHDTFIYPMINDIACGNGRDNTGLTEEKGELFGNTALGYLGSQFIDSFKNQVKNVSVADKINDAISKEQPSVEVANGGV